MEDEYPAGSLKDNYMCTRCNKDEESRGFTMSAYNDMMDPLVPLDSSLTGDFREEYDSIMDNFPLSNIEEALIAKHAVLMQAFRLKGSGRLGFSGNVICFPQRVSDISLILPRLVPTLKVIIARCKNGQEPNEFRDFRVRRENIARWLHFLKRWSSAYADVEISSTNLDILPEDASVYGELKGVVPPISSVGTSATDMEVQELPSSSSDTESNSDVDENTDGYGFEDGPIDTNEDFDDILITGIGEEEAPEHTEVQHIIDVIDWPARGINPVDERSTTHCVRMRSPKMCITAL